MAVKKEPIMSRGVEHSSPCPGCQAREEMLVFLRQQVRELQDKLLCLVPEAADRHHRLEMTRQVQMRPEAANGIIPMDHTVKDQSDDGFEDFFKNVTSMGGR